MLASLLRPRSLLLLSSWALLSCDVGGLADNAAALLTPEASLIDAPGRQMLPGEFKSFMTNFSYENGLILLGLREQGDGHGITIAQSGTVDSSDEALPHCTLPGGYRGIISKTGETGFSLFLVEGDRQEEYGTVHVFDASCEPLREAIEDVHVRSFYDGDVILQSSGRLSILGEDYSLQEVASEVTWFQPTGNGTVATIEEGQLTFRGKESIQSGPARQHFKDVIAAEHNGNISFAQTAEGLKAVSFLTEIDVASNACGDLPRSDSYQPSPISGYFAYRSPCDSPDLGFWINGEALVNVADLPGNVLDLRLLAFGKNSYALLFVVGSDAEAEVGELYFFPVPKQEALTEEQEQLPLGEQPALSVKPQLLAKNAAFTSAGVVIDWDGETGDLVDVVVDDGGEPRLEQLTASWLASASNGYSIQLDHSLVKNEDGRIALVYDRADGESVQVLEGLAGLGGLTDLSPRHRVRGRFGLPAMGDDGFLFVTDAQDGVGVLKSLSSLDGEGSERVIAEKVIVGSALGSWEPEGAIYRVAESAESSRDPGRLELFLKGPELTLSLQDHVTQVGVWAGVPGLTYLVSKGEKAGIWFAKAR